MGPQAPAFANNYVQFPVFFTLRILATFTFFFARIKHHRNRIAIPFFFRYAMVAWSFSDCRKMRYQISRQHRLVATHFVFYSLYLNNLFPHCLGVHALENFREFREQYVFKHFGTMNCEIFKRIPTKYVQQQNM